MTQEDTEIEIKIKPWSEIVASADYVDVLGLHYGEFIFSKNLISKFISKGTITISMHMYGLWEAKGFNSSNGAPCLVLLGLITTKEEELKAESFYKEVENKYNQR